MRRQDPLYKQVYKKLYPKCGEDVDFASLWAQHVQTYILPEIRFEVHEYFGEPSSLEARYPGLNYASVVARRRLGRFKHHRQLFRAFDQLRLNESEIFELCNWEGTAFVLEKFEKENGSKVRDTIGDIIPTWEELQKRLKKAAEREPEIEATVNSEVSTHVHRKQEEAEGGMDDEEDTDYENCSDEEDEEEEQEEEEEEDDDDNIDVIVDDNEDEGDDEIHRQQINDLAWQTLFSRTMESWTNLYRSGYQYTTIIQPDF